MHDICCVCTYGKFNVYIHVCVYVHTRTIVRQHITVVTHVHVFLGPLGIVGYLLFY